MSATALPLALFVGGLATGLHCAGMCGPIGAGLALVHRERVLGRQILFNAGRITSYALAGAAAGALGSAGAYAAAALPAQALLQALASAVVVLIGLHLAGLISLDRAGAPLWRRLQPLAARLLPRGSYAAGLVWGWLPCGLVYGALLAAAFAGGALEGAAAMAAFGAGTLPWLLAAGAAGARLRRWSGLARARRAAGFALAAFGAWGVAYGAQQTILCL
jgi:sulfite exporter TauE/SafE